MGEEKGDEAPAGELKASEWIQLSVDIKDIRYIWNAREIYDK